MPQIRVSDEIWQRFNKRRSPGVTFNDIVEDVVESKDRLQERVEALREEKEILREQRRHLRQRLDELEDELNDNGSAAAQETGCTARR